jgi:hypothetical protein
VFSISAGRLEAVVKGVKKRYLTKEYARYPI